MAWWARDFSTATTDLTYSEVDAEPLRHKHRDWSQAIRTDSRFAAVADVYAAINQGWPAEDDGDDARPATDLPNGNPALFADDIQHPNGDGHALIFAAFRDAYDSLPDGNTSEVVRQWSAYSYGVYY